MHIRPTNPTHTSIEMGKAVCDDPQVDTETSARFLLRMLARAKDGVNVQSSIGMSGFLVVNSVILVLHKIVHGHPLRAPGKKRAGRPPKRWQIKKQKKERKAQNGDPKQNSPSGGKYIVALVSQIRL